MFGNRDGSTIIYDLNVKKQVVRLRGEGRRVGAISHARFAAPNQESIMVTTESSVWKYDTDEWVKDFHLTSSFFNDIKPFAKQIEPKETYTDF